MLATKTWLRLGLICGFSALLPVGVLADEKPCTTHNNGNYYDLSRLQASQDHEFTSVGGYNYTLNVCKAISQETWAIKVDKPEDVAGFTRRAHSDFSLGDVNTTVLFREGNPVILMTEGSPCPNAGNLTASTAIRFICDSNAGQGKPSMIATLPPDEETACAFFVEWRTECACPTSENSVFVTVVFVLGIIVAVLFTLYLVGGTLYNRYVLELRGIDQFPRVSLFSFQDTVRIIGDCVERVKDMSSDAWHSYNRGAQNWSSGGSWGRSSGSHGYNGLRATPEEGESMLGGPPGFLDDEDDEDEGAPYHPAQENIRSSGMDAAGVIRL